MMAADLYVVMTLHEGDAFADTLIRTVHTSEEEAHAAKEDADEQYGRKKWTRTVHKLGPAIEPPEPREWAVVSASGETFWSDGPLTRAEAERELGGAEISGRLGPYRLVRVIPEDGAQ